MTTNETNQGTALDFEIPAFYNALNLDNSFGGIKIGLYRSRDERNYFFTPLIIVNWEDFEAQLNEKREEYEDSDEQIDLSLLINHSDKEIEKNIEAKIIAIENAKRVKDKKENITTTDISLNLLPFKFFKVYAKVGETKQWLNEDDFVSITPEDNFTTQLSLISERAYIIKGTFKQLTNFFNNKRTNLIWANLYGDGSPYSTTTISAIATFFNNSQNIKKIIGDEDLVIENKVKSSSSGGGFGFSLGPLSIGAGTTNSVISNEQKKKRFLNRTFVSDIINESKSEISLSVDGDTTKYSELIKGFVDKLFENKQKIETQIVVGDDNIVKLLNDQINYTMSAKESEELLKSKPVVDKSDKNKESFSYGGIKGEKDTENNFKTQDDIEWQKKGTDIIPIKIDLYLISESQLKDEFSNLAILVNRESKRNSITPFLYHAVWNSKKTNYTNSITDKDNPIGSILAFAGNRETIPLGWLLCDGTELEKSEYKALYDIIDQNWGIATDDTKFKIPNLQGQFLRGVDYDTTNISDPDAENRKCIEGGLSREVGSWQEDSIKVHQHLLSQHKAAYKNQDDWGDAGMIESTTVGGFERNTYGGDFKLETRPKNYYVNFIIRAQ